MGEIRVGEMVEWRWTEKTLFSIFSSHDIRFSEQDFVLCSSSLHLRLF